MQLTCHCSSLSYEVNAFHWGISLCWTYASCLRQEQRELDHPSFRHAEHLHQRLSRSLISHQMLPDAVCACYAIAVTSPLLSHAYQFRRTKDDWLIGRVYDSRYSDRSALKVEDYIAVSYACFDRVEMGCLRFMLISSCVI